MKKETGGPAFPSQREHTTKEGMTLRDYFAAKAMQGICAHPDTWGYITNAGIAKGAYEIADAMLKAREQC